MKDRILTAVAALALAFPAGPAAAQQAAGSGNGSSSATTSSLPRLQAVKVRGEQPSIDGSLEDAAWEQAPLATDFVQLQPEEGAEPSEPTEARVLYGPNALYVAVRAWDSAPDSIAAQLTRRDQDSYSDRIHVVIDSYFDRRTAFHFAVNPKGVKTDIYRYDDTREDASWDAVWEVETSIDDHGWTAEFRIPYSQLRFEDTDVQSWGINFAREIARHDELSTWSPLSQKDDRIVSRFGVLEGLENLESPNRLEVEPYTMARVKRGPGNPANPFYERTEEFGTVGADVKYGITSDLTLNLTLNPDFGQVEADPARVNLSAFETFLPEKRPFFLEGKNIFDFGIGIGDGDGANESLFYSRRVGRQPQGRADARGGFKDVPDNTTILGAWKLSGKTSSGWSVGALHAMTGEETARIVTGDGTRMSEAVEPLTNYSVGRLQKDFRDGLSAVGVIATATNRDAAVADELGLRRSAYTGGLDVRHRFGGGDKYQISGNVLGSHVQGTAEAIARTQRSSARYFQRPDADHVSYDPTRTELSGWSASLQGGKSGGGNLRAMGFFQARSPGFEVNDVGFMRNADFWGTGAFLGWHVTEPGDHFRRWNVNVNGWRVSTFGGEAMERGGNVNGSFQLKNLWSGHAGVNRTLSSRSTTMLRGGPSIRTEGRWNGWAGLNTDSRKEVRLGLNTNGSVTPTNDSWSYNLSPNVRWRPSGRMNLSLSPFVRWNVDDNQWIGRVEADGPRYVFGRLDQTTAGLTARMDLAFTPTLSLQLYAQPFVSAGSYDEFKQVADPDAEAYGERWAGVDARAVEGRYAADLNGDGSEETFRDPDFNVKQFRSNAVLRWQYRPGSTLFLVWSQARDHFEPTGRFRMGDDVGDLFGVHPENVLMLKVTYWFTP